MIKQEKGFITNLLASFILIVLLIGIFVYFKGQFIEALDHREQNRHILDSIQYIKDDKGNCWKIVNEKDKYPLLCSKFEEAKIKDRP